MLLVSHLLTEREKLCYILDDSLVTHKSYPLLDGELHIMFGGSGKGSDLQNFVVL